MSIDKLTMKETQFITKVYLISYIDKKPIWGRDIRGNEGIAGYKDAIDKEVLFVKDKQELFDFYKSHDVIAISDITDLYN